MVDLIFLKFGMEKLYKCENEYIPDKNMRWYEITLLFFFF